MSFEEEFNKLKGKMAKLTKKYKKVIFIIYFDENDKAVDVLQKLGGNRQ